MFDKQNRKYIEEKDIMTMMQSLGRNPSETEDILAEARSQLKESGQFSFEEFLRVMWIFERRIKGTNAKKSDTNVVFMSPRDSL